MTLAVEVLTETWMGDRGDTRGHVSHVNVWYVKDDPDPVSWRSQVRDIDAQPGDVVYVVVADYEGGDTFGRSGGYYTIVDVLTDAKEAMDLAAAATAVPRSVYSFTHNDKDYYADWTGYFEILQTIRVWPCVVSYRSQGTE